MALLAQFNHVINYQWTACALYKRNLFWEIKHSFRLKYNLHRNCFQFFRGRFSVIKFLFVYWTFRNMSLKRACRLSPDCFCYVCGYYISPTQVKHKIMHETKFLLHMRRILVWKWVTKINLGPHIFAVEVADQH